MSLPMAACSLWVWEFVRRGNALSTASTQSRHSVTFFRPLSLNLPGLLVHHILYLHPASASPLVLLRVAFPYFQSQFCSPSSSAVPQLPCSCSCSGCILYPTPSRTCPISASLSTTVLSTQTLTLTLCVLSFHPPTRLSLDQICSSQVATPSFPEASSGAPGPASLPLFTLTSFHLLLCYSRPLLADEAHFLLPVSGVSDLSL